MVGVIAFAITHYFKQQEIIRKILTRSRLKLIYSQFFYFSQPDALLPVRLRDGHVTWITWGRRKDEAIGKFPKGGWARLNSIKSGKWKPWHPRPVLIIVDQFMEKDHDNQSQWVPLDTRMAIQGLLAERDNEMRLYVVTINTPPEYAWIHDRWPRLVRLKDQ